MINKVMILDVQSHSCIAMDADGQIIRIRYKEGIKKGDKIYILDEDILKEEERKPVFTNRMIKRVGTILAAILLCFGLWNMNTVETYAMVSVDGAKSLELELDEHSNIIKAYSKDHSYTKEQLEKMQGMNIEEFSKLRDKHIIGIATYAKGQDQKLIQKVKKTFGNHSYYALGDHEDIHMSEKAKKTLGIYLVEQAIDEDVLHEIIEDKSIEDLHALIRSHPELSKDEKILEELQEKQEEEIERKNEVKEELNEELEQSEDVEEVTVEEGQDEPEE